MLLFLRRFPLPLLLTVARLDGPAAQSEEGVPYGIALAAAALLVYPATPFMAALGG